MRAFPPSLCGALVIAAAAVSLLSACDRGGGPRSQAPERWTRDGDGWQIDAVERTRTWTARVDAAGARLEIDAGHGRRMALVARGDLAEARGRERGRALTFEGAGLERTLTWRADGIKEDLVVTSPREALSLEWQVEVPGAAAPRLDPDGSVRIDAPSRAPGRREEWFRLPAPTVDDARGRVEGAAKYVLDGRTLRLVAQLEALAFPVTIDPTVIVTTTADFQAGGNEEGNASVRTDEVRRDPPVFPLSNAGGSANPLPEGRTNLALVKYGGFVYAVGGRNATGVTAAVNYAAPGAGGGMGNWQIATSLPSPLELHAAAAYDGYLYVVGGKDGSGTPSSLVYVAAIGPTGALGAWTATTALPSASSRLGVAVLRGRLYVMGGETAGAASNAVYAAEIQGNGQLGPAWSTAATLPAARRGLRAVGYGDLLLAVGGFGSALTPLTTVEVARIDAAGAIARWWSVAGPSAPVVDPAVTVAGGRVIAFGGCTDGSMPCATNRSGGEHAAILSEGTLGPWDNAAQCCDASGAGAVNDGDAAWVIGGLTGGTPSASTRFVALSGLGRPRTWTSTTALPVARQFHATASYGQYLYVLGGCKNNTTCAAADTLKTVHYARVNTNGTVGAWTATTSFTNIRWGHTALGYDGYLYLVGGKDNTAGVYNDVQRAIVYSDGSLGPWSAAGTLPRPLYRHGTFVYHGYLYVAGGADATVQRAEVLRAPFTTSGVGAFTQVSTFPNPRRSHVTAFYDRTLYVLGGYDTAGDMADVRYASLDDAGNVGAWSQGPNLPLAMRSHAGIAYDGYLYITGGYKPTPATYYSQIYASAIGAGGALGPWNQVGALTTARAAHTVDAYDGKLYTTGGDTGASPNPFIAAVELNPVMANGGVQPWVAGTSLPAPRCTAPLVASGKWMYSIGGWNVGAVQTFTVNRSEILPDGTNGPWTAEASLPKVLTESAAIAVSGRLYVVGGNDSAGQSGNVYVSTVQSDGALTPWTATTSFPAGEERADHGLAYANGYLYAIGGDTMTCTTSVTHAPVNADGTLGAWTAATPLPAAIMGLGAVAYGGYLYAIGGESCGGVHSAEVYSAPVNPDGSLGAWATTATMPYALSKAAAAASDGFLYVWGGHSDTELDADVLVAPIHENGQLGSWTFAQPFGAPLDVVGGTLHEGRLFVVGGDNAAGTPQAAVYVTKAPTPSASGVYSRLFDLGAVSTINTVTVNGAVTSKGTVQLEYRVAPLSGVFGPTVSKGAIPLGTAVALGEGNARYAWLRLVLDDRKAALVTPGAASTRDITDITLDYTGGGDATPPVAGAVNDGIGPGDIQYQTSTSSLSANWSGFSDPESGITGYQWAIGTTPGGSDVQVLTSVGLATSATANGLTLISGTTYYVTVVATNGASLTTNVTSNGVVVDTTGPVAAAVNDGTGADIDFQQSTTTINANWGAFTDNESGVTGYEWAIGTTLGGVDVQPYTGVGLTTTGSRTGLTLTNGGHYYVSVRATNGSGLTTIANSDGVVVDGTGPVAAAVSDGPGPGDIDLQTSTSTLEANWGAFIDGESGVTGYEWALGTSAGATDIQGYTSVGLATTASRTGLTLSSGTRYYVSVRATNGSGLTTIASSNGVVVDARLSLAFTSSPQTLVAGQCGAVVSVEFRDALGAQAQARAAGTLALASGSGTLRFYDAADASCTGATLASLPIAVGDTTATFRFADTTSGAPTIQAAADLGTGVVSESQQETIRAGTATTLVVSGFPSPSVAGTEGTFEVAARDSHGNVGTTYAGTVTLSSTDARATFPVASHPFVPADAGRFTFRATFLTAGLQALRAGDGTLQGEQSSIQVVHAPVSRLAVGGIPPTINVGALADLTVRAEDSFGNTATDVSGALAVTSSDPGAQLPAGSSLLPSDNGAASFPGTIRFATPGIQRVDVALVANPAISGAIADIAVADQGPPWIVQEANLLAAAGAPYRYSATGAVRALGTLPISFTTCAAAPTGFALDPASGRIDWVPQAAGPATICIDAGNSFGHDQYTFTVDVRTRAPTTVSAAFTALPSEGPAALHVDFDGSASAADPTARPLAFEWLAGDGTPAEAGSPKAHAYLLPGGYRPKLVVFDAFGASGAADQFVSVLDGRGDRPPRARLVASQTQGRDSLTVSFSCDCQPGSAEIAAYNWDLGGGRTSVESAPTASFSPGRYQVSLTVVDGNGLSARDSVEISVTRGDQQPPDCLATASPSAGPAPLDVTWGGSFGSATSRVSSFSWRLPDGSTGSTAQVRTQETGAGPHFATLRVQDEQGLACESTAWVTVLGATGVRKPHILSAGATTGQCGIPYHYSESGRAAADGEAPLQWSLTGPEGAAIDAATGAVTWTPTSKQAGQQRLDLTVTGSGGLDEQLLDVQVDCSAPLDLLVACGCSESGAASVAVAALVLLSIRLARRRRPDGESRCRPPDTRFPDS